MTPTKCEMSKKMATEYQNIQPTHQSDSDMPKNPPVEEQQEKMDRNEGNDEEQLDGASNNSDGTTDTWDDNIQVEEVVTTKIVHKPTVDTLEKGLQATCMLLFHAFKMKSPRLSFEEKEKKVLTKSCKTNSWWEGTRISQKETRFITHNNLLGVAIDDGNDLSPSPDVPPILVDMAKGDSLQSDKAINNKSSGIDQQNISNDDEEDKQCNKPIFGGGHDIPYIYLLLTLMQKISKQLKLNSIFLETE